FDEKLEEQLEHYFKLLKFSQNTELPIVNDYATPATLGKDRLAAAVGSSAAFPGKNVLSIDAGTCIKYDFVRADNRYLGGGIAPGLVMRLKAMHNFTARLPLISLTPQMLVQQTLLTGDSTTDSMLSGAINGALWEVEGAIAAYNAIYDDLHVIITGGDASFFELHVKSRIFARPNLVLEGLNTILKYNFDN
ncbi:MAG TPA: type III pantothenate kinase, partial [Chitinophagales bacterium]|nr:type III pantothenate kinase [Chitinophagales bacterium]